MFRQKLTFQVKFLYCGICQPTTPNKLFKVNHKFCNGLKNISTKLEAILQKNAEAAILLKYNPEQADKTAMGDLAMEADL